MEAETPASSVTMGGFMAVILELLDRCPDAMGDDESMTMPEWRKRRLMMSKA